MDTITEWNNRAWLVVKIRTAKKAPEPRIKNLICHRRVPEEARSVLSRFVRISTVVIK
jgi:tRNA A-37 threonylcarbamoyl transferase component Bud32